MNLRNSHQKTGIAFYCYVVMTVRICFVLDASIKLRIFWFHISQ
jgi:hypothetical protein